MVGQLRGGDVEAEQEGCGEADDRGAAEDGVDADQKADGDAPGKLLRRGPHAQEREDRKRNATIDPVVMERWLAWLEAGGVRIARFHYLQDRLPSRGL